MIYFIQSGENGPIKIGYTDNNIQDRLNQLQTANPYHLKLLWYYQGSLQDEKELHGKFEHEHIRGEWFHPSRKLLDFINNDATNDWQINMNNNIDEINISESKNEIFIDKGGWSITEQREEFELFISIDGYYKVYIDHLNSTKNKITIRREGLRIEAVENLNKYEPNEFLDIILTGNNEIINEVV